MPSVTQGSGWPIKIRPRSKYTPVTDITDACVVIGYSAVISEFPMPIFLVAEQSVTWKCFAVQAVSAKQARDRVADREVSLMIGTLDGSDGTKLSVEGPFASTQELMEMLSSSGYKIPWERIIPS